MDEFTEEEFLTQKQRIEHHYRKATTQDSPSAYLIVGQPGAGRTRMANIFSEAHNGNIAYPAHLFETEFSRPLSDAEQSQIRASYGSYLSPSDLKQVFTDYAQMFRSQNASERLI